MNGNKTPGGQLFTNLPDPMKPVVHDISLGMAGVQPAYEVIATLKVDNIEIKVPMIKGIIIEQLFEKRIGDLIEIDIFLSRRDKQLIETIYKDLRCHIEIYICDPSSNNKANIKAYDFTWYAVIRDRAVTSRVMLPKAQEAISGEITDMEALQPLTLQLIHPDTVKIRSRKTSGVFRNTNVTDMLYHLAYHFGIHTVDMTKPHNDEVYENFIIEPMYYFNDVVDYIQSRYGIYQHGISVYYTGLTPEDSRLRIYPPYHLDPKLNSYDTPVELLFVGPNNMIGPHTWKYYPTTGFDVTLDGRTETVSGFKILVSDVQAVSNDAEVGADYIGTMSIVYNANSTIDYWRNIGTDSQNRLVPTHKDNLIEGMKQDKDFNGFISEQYNPRYDVSLNNGRPLASRLAQYNCDIINIRWLNARPFTFMPGKPIKFTYGDIRNKSGYNDIISVPGLCMAAVYTFKKLPGLDTSKNQFSCECNYVLRLKREI